MGKILFIYFVLFISDFQANEAFLDAERTTGGSVFCLQLTCRVFFVFVSVHTDLKVFCLQWTCGDFFLLVHTPERNLRDVRNSPVQPPQSLVELCKFEIVRAYPSRLSSAVDYPVFVFTPRTRKKKRKEMVVAFVVVLGALVSGPMFRDA